MHKISLHRRVIKALEKIPDPFYSKIRQSILALSENPRAVGYIKLKGRGSLSNSCWRLTHHLSNFDEALIVDVIDSGHRKSIYE